VPDVVTSGRRTVAVRAPSHPVARTLLDLVGEPIAAPSANRFSYVSHTTADHVAADLGDAIDVLVDGGATPVGIESTIVGVDGSRLILLRPGSVVVEGAVRAVEVAPSVAPGRLELHYSPSSPTAALPAGSVLIVDGDGVVVGYDDSAPAPAGWRQVSLGDRGDLSAVASSLYRVLREVDAERPRRIVVEFTGLPGLGEAIDDRIRRAAGGQMAT
ncbi:MAG: L-threonylcarbamoyladenylate synthase, partial [Acidimicrobiia bacterium]